MHYLRQIDRDGDDSLARLLRRIPEGTDVLELGPATGYCTRYLAESCGCTIDAIELSPEMGEMARASCRRMIIGDIEALDLAEVLGGSRYQTILCADVLEHLRDPWTLAHRLTHHIVPDGQLLLSVPNIAHIGVLLDLMGGCFNYRPEGLLDRTHLRFFTFDSIRELLEQAGWHIWSAEPVTVALTDSEFRVRLEKLNPVLRDELLARPDALCYQWVIEARLTPPATSASVEASPITDRFQVRLFWQKLEKTFEETPNRLAWGALGLTTQTLNLEVPVNQPALALRLSDRQSFIHLHAMQLEDDQSRVLWTWIARDGQIPVRSARGVSPADGKGLWFISDTSSLLEPDIPEAVCRGARRLSITLGSPMSPDYLGAIKYWQDPENLPVWIKQELSRLQDENQHLQQAIESIKLVNARLLADLDAERGKSTTLGSRVTESDQILGRSEHARQNSARLLRICRAVPGFVTAIEKLAAARRHWSR